MNLHVEKISSLCSHALDHQPLSGLPGLQQKKDETRVSIEYTTYAVSGSTPGELRVQLDQLGPMDVSGQRHDMYTAWDVRWTYLYGQRGGKCILTGIQVTVSIIFTFPEWNIPQNASTELVERWKQYLKDAQTHEDGHKDIAIEAGNAILSALKNLPPYPSCEQMEAAADQKGAEILQAYRQKEIDYDRDTQHGVTQGAIFP